MDSPARTSPQWIDRLLPLTAVFRDDLRQSARHWAFIAWALIGLMLTIVWFAAPKETDSPPAASSAGVGAVAGAGTRAGAGAGTVVQVGGYARQAAPSVPQEPVGAARRVLTSSQLAGKLLRIHLLLWASFAIALGATSIAGEAESAPESVLCRGVSRIEYFTGKCLARTTAVIGLFLILTVPAILVGALRLPNDLTLGGLTRGVAITALALAAVTALSVAGGAWFRNPLVAAAVAWMAIYGLGITAAILEIDALSPLVLVEQLPETLRGATPRGADQPVLSVLGVMALAANLVSMGAYSLRDI